MSQPPLYLYFAEVGEQQFIKIGITRHPGNRITALRAQCLNRLGIHNVRYISVVGPSSFDEEAETCSMFSGLLASGLECFTFDQSIVHYAGSMASRQIPQETWYKRTKVFDPVEIVRDIEDYSERRKELAKQAAAKRWGTKREGE